MLVTVSRSLLKAENDEQETIFDMIEKQQDNLNQLKLFADSQKTFKARLRIENGLLIMNKAKTYQVGEVSEKTGKKKVAPGKWEDVKGKKSNDKQEPTKPSQKPTDDTKKSDKKSGAAKVKDAIKSGIKSIVESLSEYFSGQSGAQDIAQGTREVGQKLKQNNKGSEK